MTRVKYFRVVNVQPDAMQQLEDTVNAFLQTLDGQTTGGPGPLQTPIKIQVDYLNDHQSNLYAMVQYG